VTESDPVGLIGIGNIGAVFAEKLVKAGKPVVGYSKPDARILAEIGGTPADSLEAVAKAASLILCCLPNEAAAQDAYYGPNGLLRGLGKTHTVLDLASYTLSFKTDLALAAEHVGATLLDGEVSGTPDMLRANAGSIFLSGDTSGCERCLPVCRLLAEETFVLGPFGAATKMKLINNLLSAVHTAAAAEAMALGVKVGFEPNLLANVLSKGSGSSKFLVSRAPLMATRRFDGSKGPLNLFAKYLRHIPELATEANCATPLFDAARACFEAALQRGQGEADIAVVFEVIEAMKRTDGDTLPFGG
jgi:3-hydroxyisobutyrate dehydrogenase-like beta-hydroxyacid dehydrogenase